MPPTLLGCDFSSAPTVRKPIVVAQGGLVGDTVVLHKLHDFATLDSWGAWLARMPDWIGGFDFPFGLPRALRIFVDVTLKKFDDVLPAAGATNAAVRIAPDRLAQLVHATWVDVAQERP